MTDGKENISGGKGIRKECSRARHKHPCEQQRFPDPKGQKDITYFIDSLCILRCWQKLRRIDDSLTVSLLPRRDIRTTEMELLPESSPTNHRKSLGREERRADHFYVLNFLSKAPCFNKNEILTSYTYLIYWFKDESEEENSSCEPFMVRRVFYNVPKAISEWNSSGVAETQRICIHRFSSMRPGPF